MEGILLGANIEEKDITFEKSYVLYYAGMMVRNVDRINVVRYSESTWFLDIYSNGIEVARFHTGRCKIKLSKLDDDTLELERWE